jgi:hypothetical protein
MTLHFVSNIDSGALPPEGFRALLSTHWKACESNCHWTRDALLGEDRCLTRHPAAVTNHALLTNTACFILCTVRARDGTPVPVQTEDHARRPHTALKLILDPFDASLDP